MNKQEIKKFQKTLREKKMDLLSLVRRKKNQEINDLEVGDDLDLATQADEKEMLFELTDNEQVILEKINEALERIVQGTYGKCTVCGKPINQRRLKSLPWARYCVKCQQKLER
jgi:DnaK suppressor protein